MNETFLKEDIIQQDALKLKVGMPDPLYDVKGQ